MIDFQHEKCIGVLGGGQLGRMLAIEARRMGFRVVQWTGGEESGAERMADQVITKPFDDQGALEEFVEAADFATVEFENIPFQLVEHIQERVPTFPKAASVKICQDRQLEKEFLRDHDIPTADFRIVESAEELATARSEIQGDVIIKTAQFGYDGKGQMAVPADDARFTEELWKPFEGVRCIVEKKIQLVAELSVMVVRGQDGEIVTFDPAENEHKDHILHLSIVPARLPINFLIEARQIAETLVRSLDYVGVIGVEFFLDNEGNLLVNEMAPRPHNSGHHTLDACETSQFEQQARVVAGLPIGSTTLIKPVVMLNLLGDLWKSPKEAPDWNPILSLDGGKLHLYGKGEAKAKRKMGHATFLGETVEVALEKALSILP